ncbi:MAG: MSMEG_0565 family glycosyltransferase [Rhodoferax sp.]|uniref:MSMEG_0565 family glycosyltransferase n=1 Tax=Rhodoferax sp. TaxID=50421 RepID=UPI003265D4DE
MKIGLLTHSVNPRGGVVHTVELAHALHDAGHEVTVMAPATPGQQFFRPLRCASELVPVASTPPDMVAMVDSRIAAYVNHLTPLLERAPFDVLHCHDGIGGNALATLQDRGLIDGFVRTVHHLDSFAQPQLMAWQHRSVHQARQVLCVSRVWQTTLAAQGIKALEVPNGVDAARYSPVPQATDAGLAQRLGIRTDGLVLLCVGGVEQRKNTVRVLQAFIQLRAQMPQLQLVIAGGASLLDHSAYAREFQALLQTSGAAPDVLLTGPLADDDMPGLFRLADVVAMPSLSEGFGLVVLEALCSGVPVVVSRIAPFTEYLQPQDASWADPLDAASIASAVQHALRGRDAQRMAASATRLAAQFSWQRSAHLHADIYSKMRAISLCP